MAVKNSSLTKNGGCNPCLIIPQKVNGDDQNVLRGLIEKEVQAYLASLPFTEHPLFLESRYSTPKQIAAHFGVTHNTILSYCRSGELAAMKFGKDYRIAYKDLLSFIDRKRNKKFNVVSLAKRQVS